MQAGSSPTRGPVGAERALVDLLRHRREPRHVEGAAGDAVAAADAFVVVEVDDAVLPPEDGPGRGAGLEASGVDAVHALVLRHEPGEAAVLALDFLELDDVPEVVAQVGQRLIRAVVGLRDANGQALIVPLLAGGFAGFAADAARGVDELGDDHLLLLASLFHKCRGAPPPRLVASRCALRDR